MNSEELELSLRTEFESHLKSVVADMRQEFSKLQEKVEAEFEKHKSQLDAVFQEFSARLEDEKEFEVGFGEMVVEHLRLARDEGARITATAFAEAEELEKQTADAAAPPVGISQLSAAISDITAQNSQATILRSLVDHAAQFTPRGAFFIIKNEHFVGWRVFGKEGEVDEQTVREIYLPVASSTVLGESVRSLSAVESSFGTYDDDAVYLDKLEFGRPERMFAIPLVARGRGVAVLYADYGAQDGEVNIDALETLVRVAGLTVEVLASAPAARTFHESESVPESYEQTFSYQNERADDKAAEEYTEVEVAGKYQDVPEETPESVYGDYSSQPAFVTDDEVDEVERIDTVSFQNETVKSEPVSFQEESFVSEFDKSCMQPIAEQEAEEKPAAFQPIVTENDYQTAQPNEYSFSETAEVEEVPAETVKETPVEAKEAPAQFESAPVMPVESFPSYNNSFTGRTEVPAPEKFEPVEHKPAAVPPVKSRLSDRNVDLPIEVGEDERRLHNDARRFARLLVSEIKLYNEQKVKEGREAQDLYERLREAIDRSRDMYDKRVQPPVAAKFDYFHYELVSSLAEGEEGKLGGNYPGATV